MFQALLQYWKYCGGPEAGYGVYVLVCMKHTAGNIQRRSSIYKWIRELLKDMGKSIYGGEITT